MKRFFIFLVMLMLMISFSSCLRKDKGTGQTVGSYVKHNSDGTDRVELKLEERQMDDACSEIFAVKNTNGCDRGFENMIALMEEHGLNFYKTENKQSGLIGTEDVVLIKFNSQWSERGGTNTDLIRAVVKAVTEHPDGFEGEVIIADNGQAQYGPLGRGGSVDWSENNAVDKSQSPKKIADEYSKSFKISALTWDSITEKSVEDYSRGDYNDGFIVGETIESTGITITYPKFKTSYGTYVSFKDGIWDMSKGKYDSDKLKVINMPVLKTHLQYYVTASIKCYMGTTSDKLTGHNAHTSVGIGGMGSQMAYTRMPVLNILDAIWINPHPFSGPSTSYMDAVETDIIAASTDPAALDYWAAKNILIPAANIFHSGRTDSISPDGTEPGGFGYWLRKSMEEINSRGIKVTIDENRINVFISDMHK